MTLVIYLAILPVEQGIFQCHPAHFGRRSGVAMPGDKSQIMNPLWLRPRKLKTNNSQTHTNIYIYIYTYYIIYTCYIICILFVFTIFPGVNLNKKLTPPAEVFGSHLLHPSPAAASFSKGKLCQVVYRQLPNTQGLFRMNLGTSPPSNNTNAKHIIRCVCLFLRISLYNKS